MNQFNWSAIFEFVDTTSNRIKSVSVGYINNIAKTKGAKSSALSSLVILLLVISVGVGYVSLSMNRGKADIIPSTIKDKPPPIRGRDGYVLSRRLSPQLSRPFSKLGDRLAKPGNERLILTGTLRRPNISQEELPVRLIREFPNLIRLEERLAGNQTRVTGFDGENLWRLNGSAESQDEDEIESLLYDSADYFFLGQMQGVATRFLGYRFRLTDDTRSNYNGPSYDLYQIMAPATIKKERVTIPKFFYFNSDTQLLERVRYQIGHDSTRLSVEVETTGWQKINNIYLPRSIVRLEGDIPVMSLQISTASVIPRTDDGIFNNPRGR